MKKKSVILLTSSFNNRLSFRQKWWLAIVKPAYTRFYLLSFILFSTSFLLIPSAKAQVVSGWENHNYINQVEVSRKFSKFSQRGKLSAIYFPPVGDVKNRYVIIDNQRVPVATHLRVYNEKNQLLVPPTKAELPAEVAFIVVNRTINRIWLLKNDEAKNFEKYKHK